METAYRVSPLELDDPEGIGGYTLLGRLGAGGMGVVYLGRGADGRYVAIKVMHTALARQPEFLERFRGEVARARQVPSFCTAEVLGADLDGAAPYLVVEYVDGPSLVEVVSEYGPLSSANVQAVALGVATALVGIHDAGVIHRDLKPDNVLLPPGNPKVIDFGIAQVFEPTSRYTRTDQVVGTMAYLAPERIEGSSEITEAADIFAWGCIVAYASTGRTLFGGDTAAAVAARIITARPDLTGVAPSLRLVVERALAKDPQERPNARQLIDLLLVAGNPVSTAAPAAASVTGRPSGAAAGSASTRGPGSRRFGRPVLAALGALILLAAGGVMTLALDHWPSQRLAQARNLEAVEPATGDGPSSGSTSVASPASGASPSAGPARVGASPAALASRSAVPAASQPRAVGRWPLGVGSTDLSVDGTGQHPLTVMGPTYVTIDGRAAAAFHGKPNQLVTSGPVVNTSPGHSFSVSIWAYLTSTKTYSTTISQSGSVNSAFDLQYSPAYDRWSFSRPVSDTVGTGAFGALSDAPPALRTWTHLVGVYDGPRALLSLYVNGIPQGTAAVSTPFASSGALVIGRAWHSEEGTNWFAGDLADARIFDRTLTVAQIRML